MIQYISIQLCYHTHHIYICLIIFIYISEDMEHLYFNILHTYIQILIIYISNIQPPRVHTLLCCARTQTRNMCVIRGRDHACSPMWLRTHCCCFPFRLKTEPMYTHTYTHMHCVQFSQKMHSFNVFRPKSSHVVALAVLRPLFGNILACATRAPRALRSICDVR